MLLLMISLSQLGFTIIKSKKKGLIIEALALRSVHFNVSEPLLMQV